MYMYNVVKDLINIHTLLFNTLCNMFRHGLFLLLALAVITCYVCHSPTDNLLTDEFSSSIYLFSSSDCQFLNV